MQCLKPIKLYSNRKLLSLDYDTQFVQYARCGKCAACQETLSKEWYFRAYYEYLDTINKGGYMLMDCLTYAPKYHPRVRRYLRGLPNRLNFMCFDYEDLRKFLVRLRRDLNYRGYDVKDSLRYFASTEYGSRDDCTHRGHIHILFYVTNPQLDNLTLSRAIARTWKLGRTDGLPYKSRRYVNDMTISGGVSSAMRSCKYVSKYVMKDSAFQKVVNQRIESIMQWYYERQSPDYKDYETWCHSERGKEIRRTLNRHCNQFHKQSIGFGRAFLQNADIEQIVQTNIITIPDGKKIVNRIGLPTYYKRKLFYDLIHIGNLSSWQLRKGVGERYKKMRDVYRKQHLLDELSLSKANYGIELPVQELTDYILNSRGRIHGKYHEYDILDIVHSSLLIFNYNTSSDRKQFCIRFIADRYQGCVKSYYTTKVGYSISIKDFVKQFVYFNPEYEALISLYEQKKAPKNENQQQLADNKQRLNQLYKQLRQ